jgi:hypothetical protein
MATYEELFAAIKVELQQSPEDFTSLYYFVDKKFRRSANNWAYGMQQKVGGGLGEDLFNTIFLKFCKTTKRNFFCKDETPFDTTKTLKDFHSWTKKVAENVKNSFVEDYGFWKNLISDNPLGFSENPLEGEDEGSFHEAADTTDDFSDFIEKDYFKMNLSKAVRIVFDLKTEPHMVLAWLASAVAMVEGSYYRHEIGKVVDVFFKEKTLYEMFDFLIPCLKQFSWFEFSNEEIIEQRARLDEIHPEAHKMIGEMRFCDFYQKKGGRATISEWFTRTNSQIIKKLD